MIAGKAVAPFSASTPAQTTSLAGVLPFSMMLAIIGLEYTQSDVLAMLAGALALATMAAFMPQTKASRLAFVAIGLMLVGWAALSRPDWMQATMTAAQRGTMVIALFAVLTAIRNAATSSAAILECGRFLARQPPGLRDVALTIGDTSSR